MSSATTTRPWLHSRSSRLSSITQVRDIAAQMSTLRAEAAGRLSALVDAEMAQLSMPSATLEVRVTTDGAAVPGPHGTDDVELLFAANSGAGLRPLNKGASGGGCRGSCWRSRSCWPIGRRFRPWCSTRSMLVSAARPQ
ncbi:hypothetical protein [Aeromicrobium sp. UC242_57]|uniref:hypothetical protein n=1 Tax=Aeromicrobium sp. UC242_57 TaxID=3374624 RepID=UPI0037996CEC